MNVAFASSDWWIKQQENSKESKKMGWTMAIFFVFSKMCFPFLLGWTDQQQQNGIDAVHVHLYPTWSPMKEFLGYISSFPEEIFSIINYIIIPARIMLCPISSYYFKHTRLAQVQQGLFKVQQGLFKVHISFHLILHHQMSGSSVFSISHNMW